MDTFDLIAAERLRLADALERLGPDDWEAPSLCAGWSVHTVAAHLNAPWSVSLPKMLAAIARSFSLDGGFDRIARDLAGRLDAEACVAGLRAHADSHFTPPGSGPEAPLTDVLVHGADMLQPLGRSVDAAPGALTTSLRWLAAGRAKGFVPRGRVDGLVVEGTDVDVTAGAGPAVVRGPALAICAALCGRPAMLGQLSGDGVTVLASRI
jgi:uncharacterized protein (TIGR03083 family)